MAEDIVARLQARIGWYPKVAGSYSSNSISDALLHEAAAEIERLRASFGELDSALLASYAEVKELRASLSGAEEAGAHKAAQIFQAAIETGYAHPRNAACPHNIWGDCIACYDEVLRAAVVSAMGIAGEVTDE